MPELPEVEVTRRGISPALLGRRISSVIVRQPRLRYPIPDDLPALLTGKRIDSISRRAKYLLLELQRGSVLIHLGMSGSLRVVPATQPAVAHEHVDLICDDIALRLRDPRRFGALLWLPHPASAHPLLASLGIEPLDERFDDLWLHRLCAGRRTPIKQLIMDAHHLVGVGNIYASESLFRARIHPQTPAGRLSAARCKALANAIQATLNDALAAGGSSLRDFVHSDGSSGYFQQQYFVYGRDGEPCRLCNTPVRRLTLGQRASFFCPRCQRAPSGSPR